MQALRLPIFFPQSQRPFAVELHKHLACDALVLEAMFLHEAADRLIRLHERVIKMREPYFINIGDERLARRLVKEARKHIIDGDFKAWKTQMVENVTRRL